MTDNDFNVKEKIIKRPDRNTYSLDKVKHNEECDQEERSEQQWNKSSQ